MYVTLSLPTLFRIACKTVGDPLIKRKVVSLPDVVHPLLSAIKYCQQSGQLPDLVIFGKGNTELRFSVTSSIHVPLPAQARVIQPTQVSFQ